MTHPEEQVISARYRGDPAPDVSIVIPTRNRADQLSRCLHHVDLIRSDRPWELIVVDNGSTDDAAELVGKFARSAPFPVRLVHESAAGGARTRNSAATVARGEILVFIDDDCYVRPDIIEQHRDPHPSEIGADTPT